MDDLYKMSPLDLHKHQEEEQDIVGVTAGKTMENQGNVLTEKTNNKAGHHQCDNIVARRMNNKEENKKVTPPNVKVPPQKTFGFAERYKSPTDSIMSPATRGLLARNKRSMRPIELPTYIPPKAVDNTMPSAAPAPV